MRHFPVEQPMPSGWLTAAQLQAWRERYDTAAAKPFEIVRDGSTWARCYSSDLSRAYVTAQAFHAGEIVQTPLLREPDILPFQTGPLYLPFWFWRWVLRATWMTGHRSQRMARDDFVRRVRAVADLVEGESGDTLLVSHAGMMAYLSRELVRRGYSGPKLRIAAHAKLYLFERTKNEARL